MKDGSLYSVLEMSKMLQERVLFGELDFFSPPEQLVDYDLLYSTVK
jgi:hypothetical protein